MKRVLLLVCWMLGWTSFLMADEQGNEAPVFEVKGRVVDEDGMALPGASVWVKGTVVDKDNMPVIGATVRVVGTNIVTATDFDGNYVLSNVPEDATITYTYIGMSTQEVKVAGQSQINVTMAEDAQNLEEVVVIGYGSAKAKDLTAPIAVVKGDDIASIATSSPMAALQGSVPGLSITRSNAPGASPTVKIRGVGSFSNNSSPLYVVDGMFYDNIDFLNNADIEEMSILKDASAAAIYGVRAANGVIIVTTKKGAKNRPAKVTYDGYVGIQKAVNVLDMANSQEYGIMMMEADYDTYNSYFRNSIDNYGGSYADPDFHNWTYGADTDWYDELLRTAIITNHSLNISGGSEKASYAVGLNYLYQDGIMDTDNNDFYRHFGNDHGSGIFVYVSKGETRSLNKSRNIKERK